jgi:hypothetical protein
MPLARAGRGAVARTPELDSVRPVRVNNLFQGFELKPMTNPHSEIPRFVYVAAGIAAWIFAYRFVPATKGKSLEEIQATWAHR